MDSPVQLTPMKRVEIVVEAIKLQQVLKVIDHAGASGYTVLPSVTGRGHRGQRAGGALTDLFKNSIVITLVDEAVAEQILREMKQLIQNYAGIVVVSNVEVLRPDYTRDR